MSRITQLQHLFVLTLLAIGLSALAAEQPLSPARGNAAGLQIQSSAPEYTRIVMDHPTIRSADVLVDYTSYKSFQIEGESVRSSEGDPAVPQIRRVYRISNRGGVELVVRAAEFDLIENVDIAPFQMESESSGPVSKSPAYANDAWYPSSVAEISTPSILRDFRLVTVALNPVQVNPVTRQARVYHTLDVELVASGEPGENELIPPPTMLASWTPLYRGMICNLDEDDLADASGLPGSYLIIARNNNAMDRWVDSLREWKSRKGFEVHVIKRNDWTWASMQSRIRQAYNSYDPPLEFVCLMGDPEGSHESMGVPTNLEDPFHYWDHCFALMNPEDDLEDIGVGRLSGTSTTEMATIWAKIAGYERNPELTDTEWFTRGFFYAGVSEEAYAVTSNYAVMNWGSHQFATLTGVRNNTVDWYNSFANETTVINQFEQGLSFFFFRGTVVGEMDEDLPWSCAGGWHLPVCMTVTCGTGTFNNGMSLSEAFLVAGTPSSPAGGVCCIGSATTSTHTPQNVRLAAGLMYNIANLGVETIGQALSGAKLGLHETFGMESDYAIDFSRYNNLMGDPGLSMWTQIPVEINVTHSTLLPVGARRMEVHVADATTGDPVADAIVVGWKGEETRVRMLTDANGDAVLPLNVESAGILKLTVTKRNHAPYLADLACAASNQFVDLQSFSIIDTLDGNRDGNVNPGETIELPVTLKNSGSTGNAAQISATIESLSSDITILVDSATCTDLAPGQSASLDRAFRIRTDAAMKDGAEALLRVTIHANGHSHTSVLPLRCLAADLHYHHHTVSGTVGPGSNNSLYAYLANRGSIARGPSTARLVSEDRMITVTDSIAAYAGFAADDSPVCSQDPFQISNSWSAFPGHQARMMLIVQGSDGYVDTTHFTMSIGTAARTDPAGPDAFGYYAYDNVDAQYGMRPTYNYVDISTGRGTNLNIDDPGDKRTTFPTYSVAVALPFPFTFYGQEYDSLTVCSNGWCAFGDQSWFDGWKNYPIPGPGAADAMIAPCWDDLRTLGGDVGVWVCYDSLAHQYVVQWKAYGAFDFWEMLDFEVILKDEAFYPTDDNNGQVLIQYRSVNTWLPPANYDVAGCTVGIQATGGLVGLNLLYSEAYAPGCALIQNQRAILITTQTDASVPVEEPEQNEPPREFALAQNFPNPFNGTTEIRFDLPKAERVAVKVFNLAGQEVCTLIDDVRPSGSYQIAWNSLAGSGDPVASGVYICRIEAGSFVESRKMLLIK